MTPIIKKELSRNQNENIENYYSIGNKSYGVMTPRSDSSKYRFVETTTSFDVV